MRIGFYLLLLFLPNVVLGQNSHISMDHEFKKLELSPSFVSYLKKSYEVRAFKMVIMRNVLSFLYPKAHENLVTKEAVKGAAAFAKKHRKLLIKAQEQFHVPPEVVASLLWVESRHGKGIGKLHVPSVFVHLIQADREDLFIPLMREASQLPLAKNWKPHPLETMVKMRAKRKADWARKELKALNQMYTREPRVFKQLRGSYAGAFGIPQFIPSSYLDFSFSFTSQAPDLLDTADAIASVAHYLHKNGWHPTELRGKRQALFHYNNDDAYVDTILSIADKVQSETSQ